MITISKSPTADTRSCDWAKVSKEQLIHSSEEHIGDVRLGMTYFSNEIISRGFSHDSDKLSEIAGFYLDFQTGFKQTRWWDNHRKFTRHHLNSPDGVPEDVNLIDVLEMITDCVMAGMARTGSVYPVEIPTDVLQRAFNNTVELLKNQVQVED